MISVVISSYNRADLLEKTLHSLEVQTLPTCEFEVVVVNNNCTDTTTTVVEAARTRGLPVRELVETTQGLSPARNSGARFAQGEVLAFLDDDAIASPQWLATIEAAFRADPVLHLLGGPVEPRFLCPLPEWMSGDIMLGFFAHRASLGPGLTEVFDIAHLPYGCNLIVRRSAFLAVGGFDTALGRVGNKQLGGEDLLLGFKIRWAGGKIAHHHEAAIEHINPASKVSIRYIQDNAWSAVPALLKCLPFLSREEIGYMHDEALRGRTIATEPPLPKELNRITLERFVVDLRAYHLGEALHEIEWHLKKGAHCYCYFGPRSSISLSSNELTSAPSLKEGCSSAISEEYQKGGQFIGRLLEHDIIQNKRLLDLYPEHGGLLVAAALQGAAHAFGIVSSNSVKVVLLAQLRQLDITSVSIYTASEWKRLPASERKIDLVISRAPTGSQALDTLTEEINAIAPTAPWYQVTENRRARVAERLWLWYEQDSETPSVAEEQRLLTEWVNAPRYADVTARLERQGYEVLELVGRDLDLISIAPFSFYLNAAIARVPSADMRLALRTAQQDFHVLLREVESTLPTNHKRVRFCRDYVEPYWLLRIQNRIQSSRAA